MYNDPKEGENANSGEDIPATENTTDQTPAADSNEEAKGGDEEE